MYGTEYRDKEHWNFSLWANDSSHSIQTHQKHNMSVTQLDQTGFDGSVQNDMQYIECSRLIVIYLLKTTL